MRSVCFKQSSITKVHQPLNPGIVDYAVGVQQAIDYGAGNICKVERAASRLGSLFKVYQRISMGYVLACKFEFSVFPGDNTFGTVG